MVDRRTGRTNLGGEKNDSEDEHKSSSLLAEKYRSTAVGTLLSVFTVAANGMAAATTERAKGGVTLPAPRKEDTFVPFAF